MIRRDPRSYDFALDVYRRAHGLGPSSSHDSTIGVAERLRSLQPAARFLRSAYRKESRVNITYSEKLCDAYLFRYFVPYTRIICAALGAARVYPPDSDGLLRCCILGGGPVPELASLHWHLTCRPSRDRQPDIRRIEALVIDHNSHSWDRIVKAVATELSERVEGPSVGATTVGFPLTDPDWVEQANSDLARTDLLVLQNVLNEIEPNAWPAFIDLVESAVAKLPLRSIVVIADLEEHSISSSRLEELGKRLSILTVERKSGTDELRVPAPNGLVGQHLLTGESELIGRGKVKIRFLVLERR